MINLKQMRLAAGLTQHELERRSGVYQCQISRIETGLVKNPRVETAAKLASALGCTVGDLLRNPDNP